MPSLIREVRAATTARTSHGSTIGRPVAGVAEDDVVPEEEAVESGLLSGHAHLDELGRVLGEVWYRDPALDSCHVRSPVLNPYAGSG